MPRATQTVAESGAVVCDASAVSAAVAGVAPSGDWAAAQLRGADLAAPSHLPWETANTLRRLELAGLISPDLAVQAHGDLLDLEVELWPHHVLAQRARELRHDLTIYDGGYVALVERLRVPLVTLDARIERAPGIRCEVTHP